MFIILEIQASENSASIVEPIVTKSTWNEAKSEFHRISSYAAISDVPRHIVELISANTGEILLKEICEHGDNPQI